MNAADLSTTARLTRVHIENYRSIESLTLDLHPTATLLVGPNGAGKSNIIDALAFLSDAVRFGLGPALARRDGIDAVMRRVSPTVHGPVGDVLIEIEGVHHQYGEVGYRLSFGVDSSDLEEAAVRSERVIRSGSTHYEGRGGSRLYAESLMPVHLPPGFLDGIVRFDISPDALRAPQVQRVRSAELLPDGTNLNHIWYALSERHPEVAERIEILLRQIVGSVGSIRAHRHGRYATLDVDFPLNDGALVQVDGAGLSDGTLRAFALLVAVHQPWPRTPPTLAAIEEPEKALHPYAAELLFDALLSAPDGPQLLISTHSPAILSSRRVDPSMIRVVEWRDGATIAGPIAADLREDIAARLTTAPELLTEGTLRPEEPESAS